MSAPATPDGRPRPRGRQGLAFKTSWARRLSRLLPVLVVLALLLVLRATGGLQPLELLVYDRFLDWRSGPQEMPAQVAIVYFDDSDLARSGWPVSDEALARVIEDIQGAGGAVVGLDVYRDQSIGQGRERLDAVFGGRAPVIGTMLFALPGEAGVDAPPALARLGRYGFSDMPLDPDHRVRRGLLYLDDGKDVVPGFGLRSLQAWMNLRGQNLRGAPDNPQWLQIGQAVHRPIGSDFGGYEAVDARGYQLLLDFRRPYRDFPALPVAALADAAPDLLRDKIVLIAAISQSAKDFFVTPLSPPAGQALTPGVYLHAALIDQLMRQAQGQSRPMQSLEPTTEMVLIVLVGLAIGLAGTFLSSQVLQLLWPLLAAGLLLSICYVAFLDDWWLPAASLALSGGLAGLTVTGQGLLAARRERAALMRILANQVSRDVAETLWRDRHALLQDGRPKAVRVTATVMFVDLAGSTSVIETLSPQQGMAWLSRYLGAMADVALDHGGFIEKFTGDGLMVVFGAPVAAESEEEIKSNARRAVACARTMWERLDRLNSEQSDRSQPSMRLRIGIDSGTVSAGLVGSVGRMQYTVLGDAANTAARLEAYRKDDPALTHDGNGVRLGCRVLASANTVNLCGDDEMFEPIGQISLRGKSRTLMTYRLKSMQTAGEWR